jgi:hypothetical protein
MGMTGNLVQVDHSWLASIAAVFVSMVAMLVAVVIIHGIEDGPNDRLTVADVAGSLSMLPLLRQTKKGRGAMALRTDEARFRLSKNADGRLRMKT